MKSDAEVGEIVDDVKNDEWSKRVRLGVGAAIAFIPVGSALIIELGLDSVPFFAVALTVGAAVMRALAIPSVSRYLGLYAPWIEPPGSHRKD